MSKFDLAYAYDVSVAIVKTHETQSATPDETTVRGFPAIRSRIQADAGISITDGKAILAAL